MVSNPVHAPIAIGEDLGSETEKATTADNVCCGAPYSEGKQVLHVLKHED